MTHIPSIDALHKEKDFKDNSKMEIFSIVMNKCIEKIVYTNRHTDKTFVIFEVPKILIGYPSYDMKLCILYLINKLSKNSYYVTFIEPFYLYIDWGSNTKSKRSVVHLPGRQAYNDKIKSQTRELLQKFPNTSKIEFVYEDTLPASAKKKKNNKSKK